MAGLAQPSTIALLRTWQELSSLKKRFAPIVYLDDELEKLDKQRDKLTEEVGTQRDKWKSEFTETISELEALTAQLDDTSDLRKSLEAESAMEKRSMASLAREAIADFIPRLRDRRRKRSRKGTA